MLKEILEREAIQPTNSAWASPTVFVRKKDGSTRFYVDYHKVNSVTRNDAYMDDTLGTWQAPNGLGSLE